MKTMRHTVCAGVLGIELDGRDADNLVHVAAVALSGAVALSRALAAALEDTDSADDLREAPVGSAADAARGIALLVEIGRAAAGDASLRNRGSHGERIAASRGSARVA